MIEKYLYIGIPVVTMYCYMFLFFAFLNARRTKVVYFFQAIVLSCLIWTVGSVLMRMDLRPGNNFWFHVSMLGVLLLPVAIYGFLFCMLDIKRYDMLKVWAFFTVAGVVMNGFFGIVLAPPSAISENGEKVAYVYKASAGIYVLILIEAVMLVYVTVLAHKKINGDKVLRNKLVPLLIGTLSILFGNLIQFVNESTIPYDKLGGVIMAICMTYVMYKQYSFDWWFRVKIGAIYMVSVILVFTPVVLLSAYVKRLEWVPEGAERNFILLCAVLIMWGILVFCVAFKSAERMTEQRRQANFEVVHEFQKNTASVFSREEIYNHIVSTIEELIIDAEVYIFEKDPASERGYSVVKQGTEAKGLNAAEQYELILRVSTPQVINDMKDMEISELSLIEYDDEIQGFIWLKMLNESKMNYIEDECFHQITAYASACLKNASVYQKVYNLSIHDELTGLYNRSYFKDFVQKYWKADKTQSLIYMDIDDFKLFNELYGETCGDAILRWCGVKMREVIADQGATFRIGANEFAIFTRIADKDKLRILALQIQKRIGAPAEDKPKVIQPITLSVGIVSYPEAASTAEEQLQQAKKALFFAKRNGKNRIEMYEAAVAMQEADEIEEKAYEQIAPTIYALTAAIDAKDSYTFEHSCHVSADAVVLATAIGLNSNEIRIVKEAGLLHDIGKIGIPESILKKQGKLTDEEYEIMKTHVTNSIEMIHHLPNMDYVIPAVLAHHERYDGKGYPRGLEGEGIPLLGRILAVCDSFDAITSKRSYKEALSKEYAIAELERNKGTQFDPYLADTFIRLVREGKIER